MNTNYLLVVGNGDICYDGVSYFVNRHIVRFLIEIRKKNIDVKYCQFVSTKGDKNERLQDKEISEDIIWSAGEISSSFESKIKKIMRYAFSIYKVAIYIRRAKKVYIFYPGLLSRIVALQCIILRKPYALYVRGCEIRDNQVERKIIQNACNIYSVAPGLLSKIGEHEREVRIKPMIDIEKKDIYDYTSSSRSSNEFTVIFVGRLEKAKGVNVLESVIDQCIQESRRYRFIIIGGGNEFHRLQEKYRRTENVILTGVIACKTRLLQEFKKSDCILNLSYSEGFPRVIYEAMSQGVAVVTTFVGGIPYLLSENVNCIRVPINDPMSVIEAIERIKNDLDLKNYLVKSGLKLIDDIEQLREHHELVTEEFWKK